MRIIATVPEQVWNTEDQTALEDARHAIVGDCRQLSEIREVHDTEIGRGAGGWALLVDIVTAVGGVSIGVFFLGKKIEENLDAWGRLFQRIATWAAAPRREGVSAQIDASGTFAAGCASIFDALGNVHSIELIQVTTIDVLSGEVKNFPKETLNQVIVDDDLGFDLFGNEDHIKIRESCDVTYVFFIKINDSKLYVVSVGPLGDVFAISDQDIIFG